LQPLHYLFTGDVLLALLSGTCAGAVGHKNTVLAIWLYRSIREMIQAEIRAISRTHDLSNNGSVTVGLRELITQSGRSWRGA